MFARVDQPNELLMPMSREHFDAYQFGISLLQIFRFSDLRKPTFNPVDYIQQLFYSCDENSPDLDLFAACCLGKIVDNRVFPGGISVTERVRKLILGVIAWICSRSVILARLKNRHVDFMGRLNVFDSNILSLKHCAGQEYYRLAVKDVIAQNRASNSVGWITFDEYEKAIEELKVSKLKKKYFLHCFFF